MRNTPTFYRMDLSGGPKSNQRLYALEEAGEGRFNVAASVINPSTWFPNTDKKMSFVTMIEDITKINRGLRQNGSNDFLRAYASGARILARDQAPQVPNIRITSRIDFRRRTARDAVAPAKVALARDVKTCDFIFENELKTLEAFIPETEIRVGRAAYCFMKATHEKADELKLRTWTNPKREGAALVEAIDRVIDCGMKHFNEKHPNVPLIARQGAYASRAEARYMTAQDYQSNPEKMSGKHLVTFPVTNILNDPAALYNILQIIAFKNRSGMRDRIVIEGVAKFLNEQIEKFRLPAPAVKKVFYSYSAAQQSAQPL